MNREQTITDSYLEAIAFTDLSPDSENSEAEFSDELIVAAAVHCAAFLKLTAQAGHPVPDDQLVQAGHDFWFTRNRHGVGFWDGDWKEPEATVYTEICHRFGEMDTEVSDSGELFFTHAQKEVPL